MQHGTTPGPSSRHFVQKSWGYEDWIVNSPLYCGKQLFIEKDKGCRWHYHKEKDETFFVSSGTIILWTALRGTNPEEVYQHILRTNEHTRIPPGLPHRFWGVEDSCIIEFSTEHKDEDSIRLCEGEWEIRMIEDQYTKFGDLKVPGDFCG